MMQYFSTLFLVLILMIPPAEAKVPDSGQIAFDIYRNGSKFGSHVINFADRPDGTREVTITIEMKYCAGPVCFFRYEHENREIWKGDQLLSVESTTYDDGDDYYLKADWRPQAVDISINGMVSEASRSIYSTSYWNKTALEADQLLNTQKGTVEDVTVTPVGTKVLDKAFGSVTATGYQVQASVPLTVWYDAATQEWVGLEFNARGSEISYKRVNPIEFAER